MRQKYYVRPIKLVGGIKGGRPDGTGTMKSSNGTVIGNSWKVEKNKSTRSQPTAQTTAQPSSQTTSKQTSPPVTQPKQAIPKASKRYSHAK